MTFATHEDSGLQLGPVLTLLFIGLLIGAAGGFAGVAAAIKIGWPRFERRLDEEMNRRLDEIDEQEVNRADD